MVHCVTSPEWVTVKNSPHDHPGVAWATPVVMGLTATPAFASSGPAVDSLVFTSQGGSAQYGQGWGTAGQVQFWVSVENRAAVALGASASVTITVHYKGPGTPAVTSVISGLVLASGAGWSTNTMSWVVPGFVPGQNNTFYYTISAPGFKTVVSPDFSIWMP